MLVIIWLMVVILVAELCIHPAINKKIYKRFGCNREMFAYIIEYDAKIMVVLIGCMIALYVLRIKGIL